MADQRNADLRITIGMTPLRQILRILQPLKIAPILVGENYRLSIKLDNLRYEGLRDVRVVVRIWIKIASKPTPFQETAHVGYISPRDRVSALLSVYLMREQGDSDIEILGVRAADRQLTILYQNQPNPTSLGVYNVQPWSAMVPRLMALIALLGLIVAVLSFGRIR